MAQRLQFTKLC